MNANKFEAGQPLNTDDSMNDMPTFADRVRENVPEALEYLEQHPELKQGLGRAAARLEELNKMLEEGNVEAAEADNTAFISSVEAFNTTVHNNEALENKLEDHETRKLDGDFSEAEYQQAVAETKSQFENADDKLVEANADLEYKDATQAVEAAKTKIANLEMAKDDVQISEEEYKTGMAAAEKELADAEARAREAEAVITANNVDVEDVKSEAEKKLEGLEIQKLDGQLSEEEYKQAVANINNETAKTEANVEASKAMSDALRERKVAEGKIALAERALDNLDTQHLDGNVSEDEFKSESARLNAIIAESKQAIENANGVIGNNNFEAGGAGAAQTGATEASTKVSTEASTAQAGAEAPKEPELSDEEALKAWREKQEAIKNDINSEYNAKAVDLKGRIAAIEAAIANQDTDPNLLAQLVLEKGKIEEELANLEAEHEHKLGNDRNHEGTLESAPTEEELKIQDELKDIEVRRADEVKRMMAEGAGEENPEGDDGFENDEQRNLFSRLKGFFGRNKRSKEGAKKATERLGIKERVAVWGLILLTALGVAANIHQDLGGRNVNNATPAPVAVETQAEENNLPDDLSLEVDLNAEKGVELLDLVNATSYGNDIEVNIGNGGYSGETEFLNFEAKHGRYNLTAPLYDMENAELTNEQKAEQIAEGLAERLDDPIEMGQFAALGGNDVVIDDDIDGVTSLRDMNNILDLAQQDDEFRQELADYNKTMYREIIENNDIRVEHRDVGSTHYSLYAYTLELEDGTVDINYHEGSAVRANEAFDVLQAYDNDGNMVLDSNEIGGYKYNFFKAIGYIPEGATDEQAITVMKKYRIIGISGKCGQLIWELNTNPDTGTEGDQDTGTEGDQDTGTEGDQDTGTEGDQDTGTEGDQDTGTEGDQDTGTEGDQDTGTEGDQDTGTEGDIDTGTEGDNDDGKTNVLPGGDNDGWTQMGLTQEETGATSEAERTRVDDGGNGYVNDEAVGESSSLATDDFLNGGEQGGGDQTDASYSGSDTSGYDNGAAQEQGTQTISESQDVNATNDSNANQNSAGADQAPGEGAAAAMDRF